jgi:homoserine kinase type II
MAVFTPVTEDEARELLTRYALGEFVSLSAIAAGIENTNFFLTTTHGDYVLTLFEVLTQAQLPFYIELMHHLATRGIAVPQPQPLRDGSRLTWLKNKPCAIVSRVPGAYEAKPSAMHCALAGKTLAQAHLASLDFAIKQPNLRGLSWWENIAPEVRPFLNDSQQVLLTETLQEQRDMSISPAYGLLPRGPAHCDLFRDNVLFTGTFEAPRMGGIIDFYFAGWDTWLFDVAVSVNDWCIDRDTGVLNALRTDAWLSAYARARPFTDAENSLWSALLRGAAVRFWLSRLYDYHRPRAAQTLTPHDPTHFERVLLARRVHPVPVLP